jgi:hypothetical protein
MGHFARAACFFAAAWLATGRPARAQNDWQFPDPYFGVLELQKDLPARPRPPRVQPQARPPADSTARTRPRFFRPRPRSATRAAMP